MMELRQETRMLLLLMRAALHRQWEREIAFISDCDQDRLQEMIVRQSLVTMVYPVVKRQKGEQWEQLRARMKPLYDQAIRCGLIQEYEIQTLLDEMERDGLDCLPMKGWIMRDYYPEPLMRSMGDFDVLVRETDTGKLRRWMEQKGYQPVAIGNKVHDEYRKPPCTHVELHKVPMELCYFWKIDTGWFDRMARTVWNPEALAEGRQHIYQLSDEDFYIYHLLHFYKHLMYAGAGIRMLADNYVFLRNKGPQLDRDSLDEKLKALHLDGFAEQIQKTAFRAFAGEEPDQDTAAVVAFLTDETVYGGEQNTRYIALASQGSTSMGQDVSRMVLRRLFPSLQSMQDRYPRLYAAPWLLPVYWLIRAGRVGILERFKMSQLKTEAAGAKKMDAEKYDQLKKVYEVLKINS